MNRLLNVVITHQSPEEVAALLSYWSGFAARDNLLVVFGGTEADFARIDHPRREFIRSARLRTKDHQRERQSYTEAFQAAARHVRAEGFTHAYFAEYDHLPLLPDVGARQLERLSAEHADVLAHELQRVDGTSGAPYLNHANDPRFHAYWRGISRRRDPTVILSMFGSGSLWTRDALLAVADVEEPFPIYLELWLPTVAHHLGFRLRDFADQSAFVRSIGEWTQSDMDKARHAGVWTIHPVRRIASR